MKNRIDTLLRNIVNSAEPPSENLSDRTKQLFLNINTEIPALPYKKGILANPRLWTSFVAAAAVFMLITIIYTHNPELFRLSENGDSDISPVVSVVQNITTPKASNAYPASVKNNTDSGNDINSPRDTKSKHMFEANIYISLDSNSSSSEYFKPGESIKFKVSVSAADSNVKFASDPVIQMFRSGDTLPGKAVCEYPVAGFAGTTLINNQSRDAYSVLSVPVQPDWYCTVLEVKIYGDNDEISTYSTYYKNFMVEYPENGTHSSSVKVGKTIDVDGHAVTIDSISMGTTKTHVKYSTDSKISDCEIYILTDSGRSISPLDLTQDGTSVYAPVPKDVRKLIFEIRRVSVLLAGTKGQGEFKELEGSWKAEVNLD